MTKLRQKSEVLTALNLDLRLIMQNKDKNTRQNAGSSGDNKIFPKLSTVYHDPHRYPEGVAYLDSQYVLMSQAKISVLDWGFLHSDATYDVMHTWEGRLFRSDLYLDRFFAGLDKLQMSIPYNRGEVLDIVSNTVALSGLKNAYVELICTRGCSPTFSRDPRDAVNRFMVFAVPFSSIATPSQLIKGLHLGISHRTRISPDSIDPSIKNYHWLDLVGGLFDAYKSGAETALLLDDRGNIAEGPGFNIFIIKDRQLATPDYSVLPGITRRTVMDICLDSELSCCARAITSEELMTADEVFITSTAGGVMPVTTVNHTLIRDGEVGMITKGIMDAYWGMHFDNDWSIAISYPDD